MRQFYDLFIRGYMIRFSNEYQIPLLHNIRIKHGGVLSYPETSFFAGLLT